MQTANWQTTHPAVPGTTHQRALAIALAAAVAIAAAIGFAATGRQAGTGQALDTAPVIEKPFVVELRAPAGGSAPVIEKPFVVELPGSVSGLIPQEVYEARSKAMVDYYLGQQAQTGSPTRDRAQAE